MEGEKDRKRVFKMERRIYNMIEVTGRNLWEFDINDLELLTKVRNEEICS